MAVVDLWVRRDGTRSPRYGRGKRWRVTHPRFASRAFDNRYEADLCWGDMLQADRTLPPACEAMADLIDTWLAGKRGLSPRGFEACQGDAKHIRLRWGDATPAKISTTELQTWIAGLRVERGPARDRYTKPASEALRRRLIQAMRGILQPMVDQGAIAKNPADGVRVPRDHRREPHYLSAAELAQLAGASGTYAPMIWLLGTTGLRIGEAVRAKIRDVDQERRRIRVPRAKSGRGRDVPLPASVLAMLDLARGPAELVFVGPLGGAIHPDSFRSRTWARAVRECGLEGLRIHDLRHTAASLAISSGADVKAVQAMLGHATATMTLDLYGHLMDGRLDEVAERMDSLLGLPAAIQNASD